MTIRDNGPPNTYTQLTACERKARVRARILTASEEELLAVWRVLGLPEGELLEEHVDDAVGETGEDG